MQINLAGRKALVTGGGTGIGAGIALALAAAGADVAVHYAHNEQGAQKVAAQIEEIGRKAVVVAGDLTISENADSAVELAVEGLGGLDILVNNAGHLVGRSEIGDMSNEHWAQVMGVNVTSTFFTTRAAVKYLTASEAGRVILMSSLAGENGGGAGSVAYATAKAAIVGFGRGLAKELAGSKVTVNSLAPGFISNTPFHNVFTPANVQESIVGGIPLQRAGTVEDVAGAAVYLASDLSSYVTGQVIDINGGTNFR